MPTSLGQYRFTINSAGCNSNVGAGDTPIPGVPGVSGRHHSLDYRPSVGSRLRRVIRMPRAVDCSRFRTRQLGHFGVADRLEYHPESRPMGWT